MLEFEKPEIRILDLSDNNRYGKFVAEPLSRGYGTTLGTALRKIMLSSLSGAAVSRVVVPGLNPETGEVEGVRESLTDIILNVKNLAFRLNDDSFDSCTAEIRFAGEGQITGADITFPADNFQETEEQTGEAGDDDGMEAEDMLPVLELLNPSQVIATASGEGTFFMQLVITAGRGYVNAERIAQEEGPEGSIPIDALYSPVERVDMTVENTRVGKMTDYDRLILEVYSKGAVKPQDAVSQAARIMSSHLMLFLELTDHTSQDGPLFEVEPTTEVDNWKDKTIDELELSVRSYNCLKRAGIGTIGELCDRSEEDMKKIRNLGKKSLEEILQKIRDLGLTLRYEGVTEE